LFQRQGSRLALNAAVGTHEATVICKPSFFLAARLKIGTTSDLIKAAMSGYSRDSLQVAEKISMSS